MRGSRGLLMGVVAVVVRANARQGFTCSSNTDHGKLGDSE